MGKGADGHAVDPLVRQSSRNQFAVGVAFGARLRDAGFVAGAVACTASVLAAPAFLVFGADFGGVAAGAASTAAALGVALAFVGAAFGLAGAFGCVFADSVVATFAGAGFATFGAAGFLFAGAGAVSAAGASVAGAEGAA